ncbi:hypothetical protein [Bdellovibrio svalbardensis]|uniref:DZANK-type domain-containing protein n=1 Tax=Bdellovibrio svalbardensis TaxID=2972972 RepID=A0ABT6DKR2_9BACT|nr:hypothetical protein [Bdellovibrio svalbardensis]MDG0817236.1 hypothetical protein [Bdellovibrio svalbardensis]
MKTQTRCPNMNHGKTNAPVKFCPNCGEVLNAAVRVRCDEDKHKHLRKSRISFCTDCGKSLALK